MRAHLITGNRQQRNLEAAARSLRAVLRFTGKPSLFLLARARDRRAGTRCVILRHAP